MDAYSTPVDDSPPTTLTKTPTYEYYGFVLYLVSGITYGELERDRKKPDFETTKTMPLNNLPVKISNVSGLGVLAEGDP